MVRAELEGSQVEFVLGLCVRHPYQREHRIRMLRPDRQILGRDREPAEPKHITARLAHTSYLSPPDLVDHSRNFRESDDESG